MKLEYKILWLDDKIEEFIEDEYVEEIKIFLEDESFIPTIMTTNDQSEFFRYLKEDEYDLILTDFHLNHSGHNTDNGDKIIDKVRENIFTEILFYTAKADLHGSFKWDRISFLETSKVPDKHHKLVIDKALQLISLTIKKFHDIVIMRGMIMNETAELDTMQIEILKSFISKTEVTNIQSMKEEVLDAISTNFTSKLDKINEWRTKESGFKHLMKDNFVFSSSYKVLTMSKILNTLNQNDFSSEYNEEIIQIRNKFAHAKIEEERDENNKLVRKYFKYGQEGITFDEDLCRTIRKNIQKHKDNLNQLNRIIIEEKID